MISLNYLLNLFRIHRVLLTASFVFVVLFQVLILMLVKSLNLPAILENIVSQLPPPAQQIFGEPLLAQFSPGRAVAFGYSHPLVLVTISLVAIMLPVRHIAREIETGTLELLFSMPVRRITIALSLWVASALALFLLTLACWTGTGLGILIFPETVDLDAAALVRLGLNLWLLALSISSYAMLLSAFAKEGGKPAQHAAGLTLLFFFVYVAVQLWPAADFLAPVSLFYYFRPQELMKGEPIWAANVAILSVLTLVSGGFAVNHICRRDIPG